MSASISFAQFSDCHLFADSQQLHCGANVYQNLVKVLSHINNDPDISFTVFTGDLTQDHSEGSYSRFIEAYQNTVTRQLPCYAVAGNHDDVSMIEQTFAIPPFSTSRTIDCANWQIQLLSSKSENPAGIWCDREQHRVLSAMKKNTQQVMMMHHHCVDVGYFIDRHGLKNQKEFYHFLMQHPDIKAVFCGHVHNDMELNIPGANIPLYACPATCLQFDKTASTVKNANLGVGYRKVILSTDNIATQTVFIST